MDFEGKQENERILHVIKQPKIIFILNILKVLLLSFLFSLFLFFIGEQFLKIFSTLSYVTFFIFTIIGIYWEILLNRTNVSYITDRRLIRFEKNSPFFTSKRSLFWHEVLKTKAYSDNLFLRAKNIGTIVCDPQALENDSLKIQNAFMFEDIANYIDKILYAVKNNQDISSLREFVAKQKGKRYN